MLLVFPELGIGGYSKWQVLHIWGIVAFSEGKSGISNASPCPINNITNLMCKF